MKMYRDRTVWFLVAVCIFNVALYSYFSFAYTYAAGGDIFFHIVVARQYQIGILGMVSRPVMEINGVAYPPLFHLFLLPSLMIGGLDGAFLFAKLVQCFTYALTVLGLGLLVKKYVGNFASVIASLVLLSGCGLSGQIQVHPETFAILLFPLVVYAALEGKQWLYFGLLVLGVYLYSPYVLFLYAAPAVFTLRDKLRKQTYFAALASVPMFLIQFQTIIRYDFISRWMSGGDIGLALDTARFKANPIWWTTALLGFGIVGLYLLPFFIWKWKSQSRFTQMMIVTFGFSMILFPVWWARTFDYIVIPLSILTAVGAAKVQNPKLRALMVVVILVSFVFNYWSPQVPQNREWLKCIWKYWNG